MCHPVGTCEAQRRILSVLGTELYLKGCLGTQAFGRQPQLTDFLEFLSLPLME